LAAWYKTEIETMNLIMHAGCNVNAINSKGNSPLHLAVTFKPGTKTSLTLKGGVGDIA